MKNINNYENGYFSVENKVLTLKPHLLKTYLYINSLDFKKEGIWHSQETLSKGLGISIRSFQRHISELKKLGFLYVKRRGFNLTNQYRCLKNIVDRIKEAKEKATEQFKGKFSSTPTTQANKPKTKFHNFTGREYTKEQWDSLEKQLLGWA